MTAQSPSPALPKPYSLLAEVARTLIYALAIVLAVRTFFWQPFNIPSASMADTLLVGDYVWVSKYTYGYSRYSLPLGLPLFSGRIWGAEPERGDIVVFKLPKDNSTDYIKRVIGLPGDRIQVKHGVVIINGEPVKLEPAGEVDINVPGLMRVKGTRYHETLPNGRVHDIVDAVEASEGDNTREYLVPPGHYFMMGDNRDDSTDSRFAPEGAPPEFMNRPDGVGYVPFDNLEGRADAIFFSADGTAGFLEVWKWPETIRWSRIFQGLE